MLIRFTVENFLSFHQRLDFNLIASPEKRHEHHITKGPSENDIGLLRTSLIYGPNAAGKSNIFKAMAFAKQFIVAGVKRNEPIPVQPFKLDPQCLQKPARFEFEFRSRGKNYAYGFVVDDTKVQEEWLFEIGLQIESPIYERDPQGTRFNFDHELFLNISDDDKQRLAFEVKGTRENLLFLTNCQERNIKFFQVVFEWFEDVLHIVFPTLGFEDEKWSILVKIINEHDGFREFVNAVLKAFDLGIHLDVEEVDFEQLGIPSALKQAMAGNFRHSKAIRRPLFSMNGKKYVVETDAAGHLKALNLTITRQNQEGQRVAFEISEESNGTRRIIDFIPILKALLSKPGKVFIIDEIENSLHVWLIKKLFELMLNNYHFIHTESQFIATTHEVHLLDLRHLFRKDEIWLVEKDRLGRSVAYSLANAEIDHLDLINGYVNGMFGALPSFGDVKELELNRGTI